MNLSERLNSSRVDEQVDVFMKKYKTQIEALESHSVLSKIRSIDSYDVYALGKQLQAFENYRDLCEEDGTLAQLGKIPKIALDVISANYGTSPITAIASNQPIEEEQGYVYFKRVTAQTTRGNITSGDTIFDPKSIGKDPIGFASDRVTQTIATTIDATTSYTFTLTGAPVRPQTISFTSSSANYILHDNGDGNIIGKGVIGTINYDTGAITLTFGANPGAGVIITCTYATNFEAASDIPKIISGLGTMTVAARVFALKDTVGIEQSYAMRKRFGIIAEDQAAEDLVAAINAEIMATAVATLRAGATGNTNWPKAAPDGVSAFEHKQSLKDYITMAESVMLGNAGRGAINILVAGRDAAAIISTLPGFSKISDGSTIGPHIFGTLDGMIIVRVPNQNTLPTNEILALYKGDSAFDAALVYSSYMPLIVTTAMPAGVNPLMQQRAAAVWAAIENLVPQFITKITITS